MRATACLPILLGAIVLAAAVDPVLPPPGMVGPAPSAPKNDPAKKPAAPQKKAATAAPAPGTAAAAITLTPRAWPRSSYNFEGRLESTVQDVTFETPPAYQENFAFWGNRMKGAQRTELIQIVTSTHDPDEKGNVPYHRQVARFMVDLSEHGQTRTMPSTLNRDVQSLAWDGQLDPRGLVIEKKRVAGPDDMTEVDRLAFPLLDQVLPVLDGPKTLKPGETLTFTMTMPLPSRMTINGLEDVAARMTRVLTLKEIRGREAIFADQATYVIDPATPPKVPRTTCVIGGGGGGDATFDLDAGFFVVSRLQTKMTLDIEAPLRPLPGQPEGSDPGTGKSHLVLSLVLFGKQTAAQMYAPEPAASN
jgi:hypothetical protein